MKYEVLEDDEWTLPKHRGFRLMCCDCGLVHRIDFKVLEASHVMFKAKRDHRATAAARRKK